MLALFGQLISGSVVKDKVTGKSRGFGFITFADPSVLDKVFGGRAPNP